MSLSRNAQLAVTCAVGAGLALAACGGPAAKPAAQQSEEQLVKLARCLREHGVNVSTSPGSGGGGPIRINGVNPQALEAAQSACKRFRPSAGKENLTPQQKVEREEAVLKFAKCMRDHGVDIHASTAGGGVQITSHAQSGAAGGGPNPESPAFQAAQKACQGLLPFKGGGPGGGPATSKAGGGKGGAAVDLTIGGG
jgi:pyruvate/2-oxoglutarate dehydrogenase complex dihydrolipoamide acyltransferase (E2) component